MTTGKPTPGRVLLMAPQPFFADRGTPIAVRYVLDALHELGMASDLLTVPIGKDVTVAGTTIHRVPNPLRARSMPVGFSMTKLGFDILIAWRMLRMLRRRRYQYIHAVEESVFLALIARGRSGIPVIYDMASALPEHLAEKRIFRSRPLQRLIRRAERWALLRVSVVICSAGLGEYVRRIAPQARVLEWRFPALAPDVNPETVAARKRDLDIPADARIVFYCGNFADYQGIDLLFAAAPQILERNRDVYLVCVGAADQNEIELGRRVLAGAPNDRIRLIPRQPRQLIEQYVTMADVLVSPRSSLGNFPLKMFDYLAAGKPIVATDVPSHRCVLDESLALLCEPTAAGLTEGVSRVLSDAPLAAELASNARVFAKRELSWPGFVDLIARIYSTAEGST